MPVIATEGYTIRKSNCTMLDNKGDVKKGKEVRSMGTKCALSRHSGMGESWLMCGCRLPFLIGPHLHEIFPVCRSNWASKMVSLVVHMGNKR